MESTASRMALDNAEQLAAAIKSPRKSSISPKKKRQQRNGVNSDQENSITLSNSLSTANHLDPTPLSSSGPSLSEIAVMDVDHPTSGDTTASVKPKIQPNPAVCVLKTKVPALPSNPQIQGYYRRIRSTENAMWWSTQSQKRRAAYGVDLAGDSDSDNGMATNASQPLPTSQAPARMARPTNHFFPSRSQVNQSGERKVVLVPLRLELEVDGNRIRDVLTWNVNETIVTPEKFAEIYCTDLGIPSGYAPLIAESIHSQIKDYIQFLQSGASITEGHITIKIDLQVGRTKFTDQFQWDLQSEITPEEFANILCSDLSLGSEFPMLIAHAIREQLQRHLMEFGEMETNPAETGVFRESTAIQEWGPAVEELNDEDLDQYLRLQERHARRLRRESSKFSRRY